MGVVDKDFSLICIIFCYYWGAMISMKILMSYENHLSTCLGWDFNQKIGTGSIFVIGPSYTSIGLSLSWLISGSNKLIYLFGGKFLDGFCFLEADLSNAGKSLMLGFRFEVRD